MIKAIATAPDGRRMLVLGLSFGNLDRLRAGPGDDHIRISGAELDLPVDVMIFSGETEAHLVHFMRDLIGPDTTVTTSPRLKN